MKATEINKIQKIQQRPKSINSLVSRLLETTFFSPEKVIILYSFTNINEVKKVT